jgi:membrane-bound lytic murein transglycosylase A
MALSPVFEPCGFGALPDWHSDDHRAALEAFRRSAAHARDARYRNGSLGVSFESLRPAYGAALDWKPEHGGAREFFERHFIPCRIREAGFVTGFYEPVAEASPVATGIHRHPVYRQPDDLVEVDDGSRPAGLDPAFRFARRTARGLTEYFDRREIECGALSGRGLELAWLADRIDLFFIHVQGAARLRMSDGTERRITYAAKSGHPFTGPGRVLAALGEIRPEAVTMQSIRAWLAANPRRADEILWQNRSFIFFREAPVDDPLLGPVAAAKVPLEPGRSLAVDRLLHTFGTPFFIDAPQLSAFGGGPFRRLMIAQDTGSAIVGAARGDLFAGSGAAAGEIAGVVKHAADFFALLPRALAGGGGA